MSGLSAGGGLAGLAAHLAGHPGRHLPAHTRGSAANRFIGSTTGCTITEKAPTRAFSWLKAPTSAFTFKTLSQREIGSAIQLS